MHKMHKK